MPPGMTTELSPRLLSAFVRLTHRDMEAITKLRALGAFVCPPLFLGAPASPMGWSEDVTGGASVRRLIRQRSER